MNPRPGPSRLGMLATTSLLLACGVDSISTAMAEHSAGYAAAGAIAFVTAAGLLTARSWSRYFLYGITAAFVVTWLGYVYHFAAHGEFTGASASEIAAYIGPTFALAVAGLLGCYATRSYFQALKPRQDEPRRFSSCAPFRADAA